MLNGIVSHQDWLPTLLAAAGEPDITEQAAQGGTRPGGKTLQGASSTATTCSPYFSGETEKSPRDEFFYVNDDGELVALRFGDWKLVFMEQRAKTLALWAEPFVELRVPKIFNLRRDPFERADENSNTYWDWMIDHAFLLVPAQAYVAEQARCSRSSRRDRSRPRSTSTGAREAEGRDGQRNALSAVPSGGGHR